MVKMFPFRTVELFFATGGERAKKRDYEKEKKKEKKTEKRKREEDTKI